MHQEASHNASEELNIEFKSVLGYDMYIYIYIHVNIVNNPTQNCPPRLNVTYITHQTEKPNQQLTKLKSKTTTELVGSLREGMRSFHMGLPHPTTHIYTSTYNIYFYMVLKVL